MSEIFVTEENFNEIFEKLFKMQRTRKYVFRGISDKRELSPSLIRWYKENDISNCSMNILEYEKWLLDEYGKYSTQFIPYYFTPLDWVASAQHFGLPTRLVDWSFDPFCSLYFSVHNEKTEEGCYKLLVANLEEHLYFDEVPIFEMDSSSKKTSNNPHISSYVNFVNALAGLNFEFSKAHGYKSSKTLFTQKINEAREKENNGEPHHLFFCSIYDSNPRIIAQKGLFQIPRILDISGEFTDSIQDETYNRCETVFIFKTGLRDRVIKELEAININTPRLFPDLQNICEYLKTKKYNEINLKI